MISYFKTPKTCLAIAALYPVAIVTSMGLMEILNVLWAFFAIVYLVLNRQEIDFRFETKKILKSPELPIVLFIIWGVISTLSQESLSGKLSHHLGPLRIFMLYFVARFTFQSISKVVFSRKLLFAAASLGFIQAIVQHVIGKDYIKPHKVLIHSTFGFGVRAQGFFNNPLTFANAYLPFILLAFSALLFSWKKTFTGKKIIMTIFILLGLTGLTVSSCRYLIYAIPFSFLVIIFLKKWKAGVLIFVLGVVTVMSVYFSSTALQDKFSRITNLGYQTNSHRIKLYEAYWNIVKDHPFVGIGINNEKYADKYIFEAYDTNGGVQTGHSHNHFLQTLAEMGVLGLLLFLWFNYQFLYYLTRGFIAAGNMELKGLLAAGIAIFLSFHVSGLTQNTYGDSEVAYGLFYFMGLFMMIVCNLDRFHNHQQS